VKRPCREGSSQRSDVGHLEIGLLPITARKHRYRPCGFFAAPRAIVPDQRRERLPRVRLRAGDREREREGNERGGEPPLLSQSGYWVVSKSHTLATSVSSLVF